MLTITNMHRLFSIVLALILILSMISVIHYPVSAQTDEKEVNGRGIRAGNTYDFSTNAGVDKWAYEGSDANGAPPSITSGTEFISYSEINSSDNTRYSTGGGSTTKDPYHLFKFTISEKTDAITQINLFWEGYNDAGTSRFYLWNSASGWEELGSHTETSADGTITVSKTTGFSNYINGSGYLYLCAIETSNSGTTVYTDYVYVSVTSEALVNLTLSLQPGWNLITLPVYNTSLTTAEQLADALPCQWVRRYNSSSQGWEMHERNKTENNFVLENGTGYFVYLNAGKAFMVEGKNVPGVEINLKKGWNSIGWYENNTTYPEKIMSDIINSTSVAYWNTTLSRFVVHPKGMGVSNFSIPEGMGLFIYTGTDSIWDTLPTITSVEHNAPGVLGTHDKFNVTVKGDEGYTASFDIESIATDIEMVEKSSGIYKGNYTVSPSDKSGTYNVTGKLSSARTTDSKNADTKITIDTTPPAISSVEAGNINDTSATINWTTDEPSNSIVEYGETSGSHPNSASNETLVTTHQIKLTGLTPGTKHYYIVKSQDAAGNQQTSSEYNFTTTGTSFTILLVDDDDGGTYETSFQSALDAKGYSYDNWSITGSGNPGTTLLNYDVVIWFTSDDYDTAGPSEGTLSPANRDSLGAYLGNGGKLFITGQDIGYDANAGGWLAWYNTNLHANYLADDSGIANLDGISQDPISDGFTNIPVAGTIQDEITTYGTYSTNIFLYSGSSKVAGIKADNGTSRVVNIACMYFEGGDTSANKATIMDRTIKWLILPPDLTPPTFDGILFVNDTIYTGTLNLSWDPASDPSTPITYNIYGSTTPGGQNFATPTYTTKNTKYKVSGLTNGQTYYYVVRAEDYLGNEDTNTVEKSATPTGTVAATQKYAVIAGISDYKVISDLSYCDEDSNDWYYYLTNSKTSSTASEGDFTYALGEVFDHILVYGDKTSSYAQYDGVATEYNVKNALKSVVENATSSDLIFFAHSGHGSTVGGKSYLCMWDDDAGENGEDGKLYDNELSAILKNAVAGRIFVFIDACKSGHFNNELATMPNADKVFVTTTCTINGYGYDDTASKNGLFTEWFLNKGLRNGESGNAGNQHMEANFAWVDAIYPKTGDDSPEAYDGDTSWFFYLKD